MKIGRSVTYLPKSKLFVEGAHESMPRAPTLIASSRTEKIEGTLNATYKQHTTPISPEIRKLTAMAVANRNDILTGQLTAADFEANRANLDHLILVKLHQQVMGDQMKWFHLDEMFNTLELDKLLYRMTFKDNPAAAQKVGRREQYSTTDVPYDEIEFYLEKSVTSWDMPIEDPLRALISPIMPLEQTSDWSMSYLREKEAAKALDGLKYHYEANKNGKAAFTHETRSSLPDDGKLNDPTILTTAGVHHKDKIVNEIQDMSNKFLKAFDVPLTHYACSPKTAMAIAQNTWTENNTIFNVEAYRTNGGVRPFPGLSEATLVISLALDDNLLYCASKPNNVLVKAEGPKITKAWEDNSRFTQQSATLDFFQYKSAHEDLTNITRKFGCIAVIEEI